MPRRRARISVRDSHGHSLRVQAVLHNGARRPVNEGNGGDRDSSQLQAQRLREAEAMLRHDAYRLGVECRLGAMTPWKRADGTECVVRIEPDEA